jgi:hypothetical protein
MDMVDNCPPAYQQQLEQQTNIALVLYNKDPDHFFLHSYLRRILFGE